jgi:hypothetical protein
MARTSYIRWEDNDVSKTYTLQKHSQWIFVVNWLQTVLPKAKGVNMYVVDCKIEESLADNNINIDIYVYVIVS